MPVGEALPLQQYAASGIQPKLELVIQRGHSGPVKAMALAPAAGLLATLGEDQQLVLWNTSIGHQLRQIIKAEWEHSPVTGLVIRPDGDQVICHAAEKIFIFDSNTGELLQQMALSEPITGLAISPNGETLAAGSSGKLHLYSFSGSRWQGPETLTTGKITSLSFAPDNRHLLIISQLTAHLFDTAALRLVREFPALTGGVLATAWSPDGKEVITGGYGGQITRWHAGSGSRIREYTHPEIVTGLAYPEKNRIIAVSARQIQLIDALQGSSIWHFQSPAESDFTVSAFDGSTGHFFAALGSRVGNWDWPPESPPSWLEGHADAVSAIALSAGNERLLTGSWDNHAYLWNLHDGRMVAQLDGHGEDIRGVALSHSSEMAATASRGGDTSLWNPVSGAKLETLSGSSTRAVAFSPDDNLLLTAHDDGQVQLTALQHRPLQKTIRFSTGNDRVAAAAISHDQRYLLAASGDQLYRWQIAGDHATPVRYQWHRRRINDIALARQGDLMASAGWDSYIAVADLQKGKLRFRLPVENGVQSLAFSGDARYLLSAGNDRQVTLWDLTSQQPVRKFTGHDGTILDVAFSADDRFVLSASTDQTTRLWNTSTGEELCRFSVFADGSWAVVDRDGRYDASNGGSVNGLHWVVGTETITLDQLKSRYYEPGLLAKWLGNHAEPLRSVSQFRQPELFPQVNTSISENPPVLTIDLENRGGGFGPVVIYLNDKQVIADAIPYTTAANAHSRVLQIPLDKLALYRPDQQNRIRVQAYNSAGYLSSRGVTRLTGPDNPAAGLPRPQLHAVVVGTSDYAGSRIDLRFAAKDARDFARAVGIAGRRLFGENRTHVRLLQSDKHPWAGNGTHQAISTALENLRQTSPEDIVVIYLAGHGITLDDQYYYLTREARTADLRDPDVLQSVSVSARQLSDWLSRSPARKQILILDTCAAGSAVTALTEKRELSSGQIRAMERLKDRTGLHILMGSAADAVSYETNQFSQGLLTHAMLQGMRGAALRNNEFVDVSQLFQHAADRVPELARHIGGIQQPRIMAPMNAASFDFGQVVAEDRQRIPLTEQRPMLLAPLLLNSSSLLDDLALSERLATQLRSHTGESQEASQALYLDVAQFPDGYRPSGLYTVRPDGIAASIAISRNGQAMLRQEFLLPDDPAKAAARLSRKLRDAVSRLHTQ